MNIITIDIKGGLGNVMFQIATAYAISIRDNMELLINMSNHFGGTFGISNIKKYKNNILRKINYSNYTFNFTSGYGEKSHNYREIPKLTQNTKLHGYFQNEKYFKLYRNEILNLFSPLDETVTKLNEKYGEILKKNTTSLHVRRGDYLKYPNHHPILSLDYYKTATNMLDDNQTYLIFSDDIEWCKSNFDFIENKIYINNLEDYEEIYLMSMCNNNIIANSTFSWWGAWMNKNDNKTVISPNIWFGKLLSHLDTSNICCENWIKI
jgi:hypothetical protein